MAWTAPSTFVAGAILTAAQMNTDVRDNSLAGGPIYASTAARDLAIPSPFAGQRAFVTATNVSYQYSGTAWLETANIGAWTAFTPVMKGNVTAVAGSGGTTSGQYLKLGRLLIANVIYTFGTSGQTFPTGIILMDLPASLVLSSVSASAALGAAAMLDASANRSYGMTVTGASGVGTTSQVCFRLFDSTGGAVQFWDSPVTVAASDSFRVQIMAETTT